MTPGVEIPVRWGIWSRLAAGDRGSPARFFSATTMPNVFIKTYG